MEKTSGVITLKTRRGGLTYGTSPKEEQELIKKFMVYATSTGIAFFNDPTATIEEEDKIPAHNRDLIEWKRQRATTKVNLSGV